MYKMIIADDEDIILKGLCKLLDWQAHGIEIVGLCSCYDEIITCLQQKECDLLITDVSMPGKNGIEAIRYIRENELRTKVIFISGFSDFSYACDALRSGAVDYLTKPVSREGLLDAVTRALAALPKADTDSASNLLYYGVIKETMQKKQPSDAESNQKKYYTALNIYVEFPGHSKQQNELLHFALTAKIKSFLNNENIVFSRGKVICVLLNHSDDNRQEILQKAEGISDALYAELKQNVMIVVGETVDDMSGIPKSYESAENLQGLYFYCDKSCVINCEHAPKISTLGGIEELGKIEKSLKNDLYELGREQLVEKVRDALQRICRISYGASNITRTYILSILNGLREDAEEMNNNDAFSSKIRTVFSDAAEKIGSALQFRTAAEEAECCIMKLKDALSEKASLGADSIMRSKEYIKEHYAENITLEIVANHVFMNPYYFSAFFKKHTNQNFKEYLSGLRLENAKKLLITTDLRPTEIAEKTGFKNVRSFNRLFREIYGKMPSEYRKDKH